MDAGAPLRREEMGELDRFRPALAGLPGDLAERLVLQDEERRPAGPEGVLLAPEPELAEHGEAGVVELVVAAHAPGRVHVDLAEAGVVLDQPRAELAMPFQPPELGELRAEQLLDLPEVADIVERVLGHPRRERPHAPVGLLRTFLQREAEVSRQDVVEAELRVADQPRRPHRVEQARRLEMVPVVEQVQVVVRGVEDQLVLVERLPDRFEVEVRQRVDEIGAVRDGDLQQAELLRIGMEAVGLGIDADPRSILDAGREVAQFGGGLNHWRGPSRKPASSPRREVGDPRPALGTRLAPAPEPVF